VKKSGNEDVDEENCHYKAVFHLARVLGEGRIESR
jgi:hypothetical protein